MSEWQPIETAPKDGTHVLMYRRQDISEAWWQKKFIGEGYEWGGTGWAYPDFAPPTHWMPLPEPPK